MKRFLILTVLLGSLGLCANELPGRVHAYNAHDQCTLVFSLNDGRLLIQRSKPALDCDPDIRDFTDTDVIQNACYTGDEEGVRKTLIAMIQDLDWGRDCWAEEHRVEHVDSQFDVWFSWMDEDTRIHETEFKLNPCL